MNEPVLPCDVQTLAAAIQNILKNYEAAQVSGDSLERCVSTLEAKWEGIKSFRRKAERAIPSDFTECRSLRNAWLQGFDYESIQSQNNKMN